MSNGPAYLRAGSIATRLGLSVRTVRRWIANGTLASTKIGGTRLIAEDDLERALGRASEPDATGVNAEDQT